MLPDPRTIGNVEFTPPRGGEILALYKLRERNGGRRALTRYNGSSGRGKIRIWC